MRIVRVQRSTFADLTGTFEPPFVAEAIAFGPFSHVRIGPGFDAFEPDEQAAILVHEEGHIAGRHSAVRLLWILAGLPWWAPKWVARRSLAHEYEADAYARKRGHGAALLCVLRRLHREHRQRTGQIHRELDLRIARLRGEMMYE